METRDLIHVRYDKRWTIQYGSQLYDQYSCKEDATSIAKTWAENAAKQGHAVQVVIHSADSPAFSLFNVDPLPVPSEERSAA
jgi:hypothetical protein